VIRQGRIATPQSSALPIDWVFIFYIEYYLPGSLNRERDDRESRLVDVTVEHGVRCSPGR